MAALGEMAVTKYEQVKALTGPVEAAFYELLDRIDEYRELLGRLIAQEEAGGEQKVPRAAVCGGCDSIG